ncbi:aminotransferase class III-fold pyridoxal phosphate-dependent enzyme [Cellulophaga lytica]|uniref:aminotransferase class III-fold pyridoxal phosphate-dependent enzyme n=1 Tax=Cellulophaga lytica TaxID=979 RepID=UPI0032E4AC6E
MSITATIAQRIAKERFHIDGSITSLPGEIDLNFKIQANDNQNYILKISRADENEQYLDFQQKLLLHLENTCPNLSIPRVIKDIDQNIVSHYRTEDGSIRKIRLLSFIDGRIWNEVNPQTDNLRYLLGKQCGKLTTALLNFNHPFAHRFFEWDINQSLWTTKYNYLFKADERKIIEYFQDEFSTSIKYYNTLRKSIVHNDANDNNIIVSEDVVHPIVKSIIDYGDTIHTQIINDVAIACAYGAMGQEHTLEAILPIVKGYHSEFPLMDNELQHLYIAIAMRLVISVTKSAINKEKEPSNSYLQISEKQAWQVLKKWISIDSEFAYFSFRKQCELLAHPNQKKFKEWSKSSGLSLSDLFANSAKFNIKPIDLGVGSKLLGHYKDATNSDTIHFKIAELLNANPNTIFMGGYLEPRISSENTSLRNNNHTFNEERTIHLGTDFWLPEKTEICTILDAVVISSMESHSQGVIVLEHNVHDLKFYTLYSNLSYPEISGFCLGDSLKKGHLLSTGKYTKANNFGFSKLHFQILLSPPSNLPNFTAKSSLGQLEIWGSISQNPLQIFPEIHLKNSHPNRDELLRFRNKHLGKSLSLQYQEPLKIVQGYDIYLIDEYGRKYMDTVNNVAHVGHEHQKVVKAATDQIAVLNTNSRYLHENINNLAYELLRTLPPSLNVLHFVNSGSEANELAIRMVKAVTGEKDIIASEIGYHGNSNMCIDISSYKFDGKGGSGAPEYTHIFPLPDTFRGKYRDTDAPKKYALEVLKCIDTIKKCGRNVGALIVEPIISCGGQIELPKGFLKQAYKYIKKEGGLCISDEVQVGCGRLGKTFWGFELHDVTPDIVTIGKPLGNGHPLAAVACTQEVAEKFANGMEYFNTFGGNPVSCAIGTEVLKIVRKEGLQENAFVTGEYLKRELVRISLKYPIIGDVRGEGLFLGFELVTNDLIPLPEHSKYLINRMKDYRILMSTDGPDNNVIKIKPPLTFSKDHANYLIKHLELVFNEDFMQKP